MGTSLFDQLWEEPAEPTSPFDALWAEPRPTTRRRPAVAPAPAPEDERGTLSNIARGLATGVAQAGTTTLGALGTLTGSERLKEAGERYTRGVEEYFDPEGTAGAIAKGVGRIGGEIGTSLIGGGALLKGATAIPKVGTAIKGASTAQKALAAGAAQLPIDVVQGAKEEEGLLLPGRAGAIAESVGLGAIGTGIAAARSGRRAAQAAQAVPAPALVTEVAEELPAARSVAGVQKAEELTPSISALIGDESPEVAATLRQFGVVRERKSIADMNAEGRRLLDNIAPGVKTKMTDEEFTARAVRTAQLSDALEQTARRIADDGTNSDDVIRLQQAHRELFDQIVREAAIVQPELSSAGRRMAVARQVSTRGGVPSAINTAKSLIGLPPELDLSDKIKDEIRAIFADPKYADPEARANALQNFYTTLQKRPLKDVVLDVRRVGLLSNPATLLVNFMGGAAEAGQNAIAHPIALGMDKVISAVTGKQRTVGGATRARDWMAEFLKSGKKVANPEALKRLVNEGIQADDIYTNLERQKSSIVRDLGLDPQEGEAVFRKVARMPLRVLDIVSNAVYGIMEATDIPFYRAALATSLKERAAVRALNEGLGNNPEAFVARVKELMSPDNINRVDAMLASADALDATYKTPTGLSRAIQGTGGMTGTALRFAVPFVNTPTNIVRKGLESLPGVGTVMTMADNKQIAARMKKLGASAEEISNEMRRRYITNFARQATTGAGGIGAGYLMHQAGVLTPEYTPAQGATPEEREAMQRRQLTGEAPLAIRSGNESYSLSYMATLAPALAIGAALSQAQKDDTQRGIGLLGTATKTAARTVLEMPLLQGVSNIERVITGTRKPGVALGREVGSFVPSAVAAFGRGIDVTPRREPETFGQAILERVPVARERLAPVPGAFGETQEGVGVLREMFDPTRPRKIRTGGIYDQLQQLEVYPGQRARRPDETAQAYFERRQREGEQEKAVLEGILSGTSPSLRNVSASARKEFRRIQREQGDEEAVRQLVGIALRQQRSRMSAKDKKDAERLARREGLRPSDPTFDARVRQLMAGQP
jgi:ribosomal protein S19E (S16A)